MTLRILLALALLFQPQSLRVGPSKRVGPAKRIGIPPGNTSTFGRIFNGSTDALNSSTTIDLTATSTVTFSFWLWQNSFVIANELIAESSTLSTANNGAFYINADSSNQIKANFNGPAGQTHVDFGQPSTGAWHHYLIVLNASTAGAAWVDGVAQSNTGGVTASNGNYGNFTVYLMSRAATSLFNAGKLADFAVYKVDESANVATLAGGALASSVDATNLISYVHLCGTASPEPDSKGAWTWTLTGTPAQTAGPGLLNCP